MNENTVSTETITFKNWLAGMTKIYNDYMTNRFPNLVKDPITYVEGSRYIRVIRGGSAHAFIDRRNGDVLKPATWKAPAKGMRGNIFDESNGLSRMTEHGPMYLR
jgi:hypothetical protein